MRLRGRLRRPSRVSRPVAVLVGAVVGLGALGGATGAVLGQIGGTGPAVHQDQGHQDQGRHHHGPLGRIGDDADSGPRANPPR